MPKRPQVSIRGEVYQQVKEHCEKEGIKITDFIDELCSGFFGNGSTHEGQEDSAGPLFDPKELHARKARF